MHEGVEGADDTVWPCRVVAGEVGQLPEDDVDADSADESDHDGVRHEPQRRPEPEEPGDQHDDAAKHRERKQGTRGITGGVNSRDVGHDYGHGSRGLDSHERRAGEAAAGDRAEHVSVQARQRVDTSEQTSGEAVGDAHDAERQARDRVLSQRVPPDREAEFHLWQPLIAGSRPCERLASGLSPARRRQMRLGNRTSSTAAVANSARRCQEGAGYLWRSSATACPRRPGSSRSCWRSSCRDAPILASVA